MKKALTILLLFCFFLNVIGYHLFFQVCTRQAKNEMQKMIHARPKASDLRLVFSSTDKKGLQQLDWQNEDEFYLDGNLYDVSEKNIKDGYIVITAVTDKKETALAEAANGHWKNDERSNKLVNDLFQLFQNLFSSSKAEENNFVQKCTRQYFSFPEKLFTQLKEVVTPPPQC